MQTKFDQPIPDLPSLEPGVTLLESTKPGPLQTLVVDHVLLERESAWWIDTFGHAQTEPLSEIAPSRRALDRINVARAFTGYQHNTLCKRLLGDDSYSGNDVDTDVVGLIVAPALDGFYRDDEMGEQGQPLFMQSLAKLAAAARRYDCPVLVSRTRDDEFTAPIDRLVNQRLECESTQNGPRFTGEEFETLVYPLGDGWVQTTIAFWNHILEKRKPIYPKAIGPGSIREVA
ncbi:hypothetical protein [Natronorubrum daqingense]|uniref:DNA recombination and repair protein Rad51-like C-terminal domain-containing protein n=1 Tax=Natronorubrum daqingense TaxID=588898 RepID=A0A1N7GA72_9EURY|nr:hypothetical protein [Natronorubrum daqingense]APX98496.1 hypothetical protein BB347_17425 [Natronorubrum daqingense]SIS09490.1 hypothetical protein SAMN05421809_3835 [Natronorubrum daqingense]